LGCGQQLICARPYAYVFGEVLPAHNPGAIDEKLGGPGYVVPIGTTRGMQNLVTANHFRVLIGEKQERVAFLAAQSLGYVARIDTDCDRENAMCLELGDTVFDAS